MTGYVYLIGSPKFGWYKIGKSIHPNIRIRDLGILLPFSIEVIALWKASNYSFLETMLHEKYAAQQINGEWFSFDLVQLRSIFEEMIGSERVFPTENINLDYHLLAFVPKNSDRKTHGKQLARLIVERMEEILVERGMESTPQNRKLVRRQVLNELRLAKEPTQT